MYALAIVHISVNIKRCLQGIIDLYSGKINPLNFLNSDEGALNAIRLVVYLLQSLLADGLMIYRLYVVCGVNFRFLGPVIILFVGNIICGVGTMAGYIEKGSLFQFGTSPLLWLEVFFLITLAINLFGIISITVRIWLTMRRTSGILQSPSFSPLTVTLLDPGMVYSVSLLALFGQYVASSLSFFAALDYEIQIIGIMLSLIVVRVSFRSLWNGQLNISPPQIHVHCIQAQSTARSFGLTVVIIAESPGIFDFLLCRKLDRIVLNAEDDKFGTSTTKDLHEKVLGVMKRSTEE
ncbi:uncharacterized protein FOMMEDRAFT_30642 [Fomitiporia mediterranea MF3/22]|uniref:uncharacterized protein n=1 Tax=Fomitiporia mediterranea (strain MF3/22) TaxID=694068 RepID=UPI0004408705|nr:uncharacterized protein FOMMEDRAFT_30642 [Fomitiporia mediterranea MF3/22]EJD00683.1 hypothetical protein FOMMEDRAFT_30642 [Fomitiporia mediterranea MF3/22]